jgi:dCTP deaminase
MEFLDGAVLSKAVILQKIAAGEIKITPYDPIYVGSANYDLTLSNKFRYYKTNIKKVRIDENTDYKAYTEKLIVPAGDFLTLLPGETILGITREQVALSGNICALFNGRSRYARMGLSIHITAPFVHPGISGQIVLEINNASPYALELVPGTRICHLVFLHMDGKEEYRGRFFDQEL